jgi:methylphosphotriester-DNA--protein-cysteine methyltransferase
VPSEAPFIGDVKTMIYHEANAENLPAEQNRMYFASEEEAHEAGFQRDRDEVPNV